MFSSIKAAYNENHYPIYISDNLISNLKSFLDSYNNESILIVYDDIFNNTKYHPDSGFTQILNSYNSYQLRGGIESKTYESLIKIINKLNQLEIPRDGILLAIGGGVVGDVCGLAASLYHRGMKLVHVPTTMTGAVDSVIGGKTAVNMNETINLIGTYYHPIATFIDLRFFDTLDKRDFTSGIAESIKKAIMSDSSYYDFLSNNYNKILNHDINYIYDLVYKSISIKLFHTISDVHEKSNRLLLNYGHTFGQAIESCFGIQQDSLRHGEAVSLGMVCASNLSEIIYGGSELKKMHKDILSAYSLPTTISEKNNLKIPKIKNLINNLKNDKKKTTKGNRFILCDKLGSGKVEYISNLNYIENSFMEVLK